MAWTEKVHPSPFDTRPISGLFFLDGDLVTQKLDQPWTIGMKYATIVFPSGAQCTLRESADPTNAIVHVFGDMDVRLRDSRDVTLQETQNIGGYTVRPVGDDGIEVIGRGSNERATITYDPVEHQLSNVVFFENTEAERPTSPLLDRAARAILPPLHTMEKLGLDAVAPIKFFSSDMGWTWYASEFDGEDLFFGLVNGYDLEFGYFTLSELEGIRGPLGLAVERDIDYEPKTLRELQMMHRNERRQG